MLYASLPLFDTFESIAKRTAPSGASFPVQPSQRHVATANATRIVFVAILVAFPSLVVLVYTVGVAGYLIISKNPGTKETLRPVASALSLKAEAFSTDEANVNLVVAFGCGASFHLTM